YVRISSRRRLDPLIQSLRELDGPPATHLELFTTAALAVEHAVARGDPSYGAELARRALESPAATSGPWSRGRAQIPLVLALIASERLEEAEAIVTAALDAARNRGAVLSVAVASSGRSGIRLRRDDLLGAEADAVACLEL